MSNAIEQVLAMEPVVDEAAVARELEGYLEGYQVGWQPADDSMPVPRWTIDTMGKADWAMRKLAEIRATAQQYRDEVTLWQQQADRVAKAAGWFEDHLKAWALASRTKDRKSFPLAHGTVSTTERKRKAIVVDEAAAIDWAEGHCQAAVATTKKFQISNAGASVVDWLAGWDIVDKLTGDHSFAEVEPCEFHQDMLDQERAVSASLLIEPVFVAVVVAADGRRIPGLDVAPSTVSASVQPLGL